MDRWHSFYLVLIFLFRSLSVVWVEELVDAYNNQSHIIIRNDPYLHTLINVAWMNTCSDSSRNPELTWRERGRGRESVCVCVDTKISLSPRNPSIGARASITSKRNLGDNAITQLNFFIQIISCCVNFRDYIFPLSDLRILSWLVMVIWIT